ncbi:LPXTG-motif cell wall anchor domain protein [[Clostridium] methylpentosum DSM 5476]|uniref:LPXTG-motif cell wall anchor domain protein n=1 Tax=[Clostridium] methylpentosum DSM 5476 TaxID=537013 RepID=C0EGB4_9FIRM|nr:LPXTG-motif cell wall anchor domain protein [[Clostridium] methylpentosum DSM 5476]MDY3988525.1 bacterial Ig-like domain-containing protein [Massilioclostridium sp.]
MNWKKRAIACFIAAVMITASLSNAVAQNTDNNTQPTAELAGQGASLLDLASYTAVDIEEFNGESSQLLSTNEERASQALKKAIEAGNPSYSDRYVHPESGRVSYVIQVDLSSYRILKKDAKVLLQSVIYRHPELFYATDILTYNEDADDGYISNVLVGFTTYGTTLANQKKTFEANVQEALSNIDDSMTTEQKILVLYDYITTTTHYDYTVNRDVYPNSYSAYGVFGESRMATCNGYALAFNVLMDRIGVENVMIGSVEKNHAWSKVNIGGSWYNVDPTWDDTADKNKTDHYGSVSHKNFLVSDANLTASGHGTPASTSNPNGWKVPYNAVTPTANSTKYENEFWTGITSTVLVKDGRYYYVKDGRLGYGDGSSFTPIGASGAVETFGQWKDRIYYATGSSIRSVKFDGTDDSVVEGGYISNVTGMTVRGGNIYYQRNHSGSDSSLKIKEAAKPVSISMYKTPSITTYKEGMTFDPTGGVIRVKYSDNSTKDINLTAEMCSSPDMNRIGTQTVTVSYEGFKTNFSIQVVKKALSSIEFSKGAGFTDVYKVGQELNLTGANLKLNYDNGTSEIIPITASMVSGYDKNALGGQTVNVNYGGKHTNFLVTVYDKLVEKITLIKMPDKTEYIEGTALDLTGAQVLIEYDNDTSETCGIAPQWCTGYDKDKVGEQTVTVTYNEVTTSFKVRVVAKSAVKFELPNKPVTTEYIEGQAFNPAGATLLITYNNGTQDFVNVTSEMCSGFDMSVVGEQTVSVSWNGQVVGSFTINVREKQVTEIALTEPDRLEYLTGDLFSVAGGSIEATYDNDTKDQIELDASMCSTVDLTKAGAQTVTVSYGGKEVSFEITVYAREAVNGVDSMIDAIDLDNLSAEDAELVQNAIDGFTELSAYEQSRVADQQKLYDAVNKMNSILYPPIQVTKYDITVTADVLQFPAGTEIGITEQELQMTDALKKMFGDDAALLNLFDLTVESKQELNGEGVMTVTIKLGEQTDRLGLAYLDADGKVTELTDFNIENGTLIFTTKAFGRYAVVQKAETSEPDPDPNPTPSKPDSKPSGDGKTTPKTGETNPLGAAVPLVMLSASTYVLLKKRRKEDK